MPSILSTGKIEPLHLKAMIEPNTTQNHETDNPTGGLFSLSTVSGIIFVLSAVVISGGAIVIGQSFVGQQVANPGVFDSPVLSVGGAIVLIIGLTFFLLVGAYFFLAQSLSEPGIKNATDYQLIGAGGLVGLATASALSVTNAVVAMPLQSGLDSAGSSYCRL